MSLKFKVEATASLLYIAVRAVLSHKRLSLSFFHSAPAGTAPRPLGPLPGAEPGGTHVCLPVVPHPLYGQVPPLHGFPHR